MDQQPSKRSYLFMAVAILGWGMSVPLISLGLKHATPLSFLAYRFSIATLMLSPVVIGLYRPQLFEIMRNKWLWVIGLAETTGLVLQYLGQGYGVPDGLAALLSLCFLLIVPFLSPAILGEKLQLYHLVAICIGGIGVVLLFTNGDLSTLTAGTSSLIGEILLLGAAFSYALYIVATSRLTTREKPETNSLVLFYGVLLIISTVSFTVATIFEGVQPPGNLPPGTWIWLLLLVLLSTLIAFVSYFVAMKEISANSASVLLLLQVLIPFSFDFLIYKIGYGFWVLIGSGMVLAAMIIVVGIPLFEDKYSVKTAPLPASTEIQV